ncbi:MAG: transposase [Cyanobacteria bacterium J06635_15]
MELYQRLEQIIVKLRPGFSREAPFEWFVILLWGVLLTTQPAAVTSYLNAVGLGESYYHQALHWFSSSAFSIDDLCYRWGSWLREHAQARRLKGQRVYVGDGIKVSKEGRKMPGVKGLHQESEDVSKPEWIRGHYFSALGLLLGAGQALFVTPIVLKLHDGIETVEAGDPATLVEKMATLCVEFMVKGSYAILDAYYASAKVLKPLRENDLYLISRARITTVAHAAFSRLPGKHGPGRPREWGSKVKLRELFAPLEDCLKTSVWLYGQKVTGISKAIHGYGGGPLLLPSPLLNSLNVPACGRDIIPGVIPRSTKIQG